VFWKHTCISFLHTCNYNLWKQHQLNNACISIPSLYNLSFLTVYDILIYFKHTRGQHDELLPFLKTLRITNCCSVLANMKCVKQILLQKCQLWWDNSLVDKIDTLYCGDMLWNKMCSIKTTYIVCHYKMRGSVTICVLVCPNYKTTHWFRNYDTFFHLQKNNWNCVLTLLTLECTH